MATAAVLCIGTELTRGELLNTNATWLAEALTELGCVVLEMDVVPDHAAQLGAALARLGREYDVLVCTGGLGPTTDDITTECVARVLGVPLERNAEALAAIRARLERFGRTPSPSNDKQADFPRGAEILPNPKGTAPGFSVRLDRALTFVLPGVPREMVHMFRESVAPKLRGLVTGGRRQILLRTHGLPESEVNDRLAGIEADFGVTLGYRASFPVIEVKVHAEATDEATAAARARAAADAVRERLGARVVFAEGDVQFAEAVGKLLVERGLRLGCAESCTGGLVGQLLTERSGASRFFAGSIVAYENAAKTALLGVPSALIEAHGAVSREVARAMAEGARARFGVDVVLSITGIAGPEGGTAEKPVGLVHYAVATADGTTDKHFVFAGERDQIRLRAAYAALSLVMRVLYEGHANRAES
ncbi:MAG: competence/damage-inducible protein A [Pseudomonadota bacterium]|nr:MAG: competence/damage-inducible protein A [Pseudomonadota bacterium]